MGVWVEFGPLTVFSAPNSLPIVLFPSRFVDWPHYFLWIRRDNSVDWSDEGRVASCRASSTVMRSPVSSRALRHTPVVVVLGARQVGKSTLVERIAKPYGVPSIDDQATRQAAQDDPTGFIADLITQVVIDEVQRAPDLLMAIKQRVDRDRRLVSS